MTKKQKRNLKRIIISTILFLIVKITDIIISNCFNNYPNGIASLIPFDFGWLLPFILYFIIYIYIGHDVLKKAFKNIINGQLFDENFLMSIATIGAFGLGIYTGITENKPEGFDEGCAVLLFYQLGEWFQGYAVGKSRKSISSLMDIRPDYANKLNENNEFEIVEPELINVGDIILVKPGEKIPLDGVIIKGNTSLDTKALTGEALPKEVGIDDEVISGTINLTSNIEIRVSKEYSESTVAKILDLVENASSYKSKSENFITKFSKYYTPIVVILAFILAIIPPIVVGISTNNWEWSSWIYRALSFLVVSCPCALVISIPLSFFAGIGGASNNGILIKGSSYLEMLNKANIFVFDKTGTLTKGNFKVIEVYPNEKKDEILQLAANAEGLSNHPIAKSIKEEYAKNIDNSYIIEDISGKGIKAIKDNEIILCGNEKLLDLFNIKYNKIDVIGTIVYVVKNNELLGHIVISDEIKPEAYKLIDYINSINGRAIMLTGDNEKIAGSVANSLHINEYKASLLPQDKALEVNKLLNNKNKNDILCFVGDGINDAPVLMASDIGISMGGIGSDAAIEASDIVLMHDNLDSIIKAKIIAKKTMRIVLENIIFALGIKIAILILSALGITNMWFAVFGDVGVAVIAILNAMRANYKIK